MEHDIREHENDQPILIVIQSGKMVERFQKIKVI